MNGQWGNIYCCIFCFYVVKPVMPTFGFPKFYKVGNVANTDLHGGEENKFSTKNSSSGDRTQDLL